MSIDTLATTDEPLALSCPPIGKFVVTITEDALEQRKFALECLGEIVSVQSIKDRDDALAALSVAKSILKRMEDTRTAVKAPVLAATKEIDGKAKAFSDGIKVDQARVERLLNDWQAKANAVAEELRLAELADLAKQNAAAGDNLNVLRANAEREAELQQPTRVDGARHTEYFEYDILPGGLMELAQQRPDLVTIEPKRREILAAISQGALLPGLRVYRATKLHAKASL